MDAFAVSVSDGMCYKNLKRKQALMIAFTFGFFQAAMPTAGYFAGRFFSEYISTYDHWVALILLSVIGVSMAVEGIREIRHPHLCNPNKVFSLRMMLMQGVATSIDALAVGISLAVLNTDIVPAAAFIGLVTFVFCYCGVLLGKRFGAILESNSKILGGAILVVIGVKIFIEHMTTGG